MTVSGPVAESLAGRGAGKVAARRNRGGAAGRVGWPTYLILGVVLLLSAYPLYYSFLLGSSDAATIAREPVPSLIPQGNFLDNVVRVVSSDIKFCAPPNSWSSPRRPNSVSCPSSPSR